MITFAPLSQRPSAFQSLTGMTIAAFETWTARFLKASAEERRLCTQTRRHGQPRKRAVGAGHRFAHEERDRLLMALVWLRIYPTYEVLGFLFSLNKTNARRNVERVLEMLEGLAEFPFERPSTERVKLRSVRAVMDTFPEIALIIDTKEQRIQRPSGKDSEGKSKERPYYSGKKRAHTLKNQIAVSPDGRIAAVSPSFPGGAPADITLLRQSGLLKKLAPDEGAMFDKAYVGLSKDFPNLSLRIPTKAPPKGSLTDPQKAANRTLAKERIVVEHTNAQLQNYQVLAHSYRHALKTHSRVFRVVALLTDQQISQRPLKVCSTA